MKYPVGTAAAVALLPGTVNIFVSRLQRPALTAVLDGGAWRYLPFLARSLESVLDSAGLPRPALDTIAIWTHVAGQPLTHAPSPLAFLPFLLHTVVRFTPPPAACALSRRPWRALARRGESAEHGRPAAGLAG